MSLLFFRDFVIRICVEIINNAKFRSNNIITLQINNFVCFKFLFICQKWIFKKKFIIKKKHRQDRSLLGAQDKNQTNKIAGETSDSWLISRFIAIGQSKRNVESADLFSVCYFEKPIGIYLIWDLENSSYSLQCVLAYFFRYFWVLRKLNEKTLARRYFTTGKPQNRKTFKPIKSTSITIKIDDGYRHLSKQLHSIQIT